MKIKVDFDLCESNALCEALAPEVFELDDDDFLQLKTEETTPENIENVKRAVAACPRAAISLEDEAWVKLSLDGRVAVVTGAGAGLGRAEARRPGQGRSASGAQRPARCCRRRRRGAHGLGAEVAVVEGDVGERATADACSPRPSRASASSTWSSTTPGMTRDRMLFNLSDEEWDDVIRVHLRGHFLLSRNAAAYWRERAKAADAPVYGRHRQHRLGGLPGRVARPGQLRRGQGRHRRAHAVLGARPGHGSG